jgi:hypothetical protein
MTTASEKAPVAVDIAQASELTGLSQKALRRRVERGTLQTLKWGNRRMVPISELQRQGLLGGGEAPERGVEPRGTMDREADGPERLERGTPTPGFSARGTEGQVTPPLAPRAGEAAVGEPARIPNQAERQNGDAQPAETIERQAEPENRASERPETAGTRGMGDLSYFWYGHRALSLAAIIAAIAVLGALVWLVAIRPDGGNAEGGIPRAGAGPVAMSEPDLATMSDELRQPVYWAGPVLGAKLEVTRSDTGLMYVRYLTDGASIGDLAPDFLTVGTYPALNALDNLRAYAQRHDATVKHVAGGGVAVPVAGSPTSVFLAYPHQDIQVEVYDPNPRRALSLATLGVVEPVS